MEDENATHLYLYTASHHIVGFIIPHNLVTLCAIHSANYKLIDGKYNSLVLMPNNVALIIN